MLENDSWFRLILSGCLPNLLSCCILYGLHFLGLTNSLIPVSRILLGSTGYLKRMYFLRDKFWHVDASMINNVFWLLLQKLKEQQYMLCVCMLIIWRSVGNKFFHHPCAHWGVLRICWPTISNLPSILAVDSTHYEWCSALLDCWLGLGRSICDASAKIALPGTNSWEVAHQHYTEDGKTPILWSYHVVPSLGTNSYFLLLVGWLGYFNFHKKWGQFKASSCLIDMIDIQKVMIDHWSLCQGTLQKGGSLSQKIIWQKSGGLFLRKTTPVKFNFEYPPKQKNNFERIAIPFPRPIIFSIHSSNFQGVYHILNEMAVRGTRGAKCQESQMTLHFKAHTHTYIHINVYIKMYI